MDINSAAMEELLSNTNIETIDVFNKFESTNLIERATIEMSEESVQNEDNALECKTFGKNHETSHKCQSTLLHCNACGKTFSLAQSLKRHEDIHRSESFNCKICGKMFSVRLYLKRHEKRHNEDPIVYRCNVGSKSFTSSGTFMRRKMKPFQCVKCHKKFRLGLLFERT